MPLASRMPEMIDRLRSGDVRSLARAISLVEDESEDAPDLLRECFPYTGGAVRIGVTGSPGAGKSTLVDLLVFQYRQRELSVGVLAVDPSSPYSGGALLGDRIRMEKHFADPGFYLRSSATRGVLGGLAAGTADVASILDASGKERILIETVGVGQDEVDIVRLADVTLVVLVPGMGDDVQSIKAGIMEIADIFVLNKSDREGADRVEAEIRALQALAGAHDGWVPPIVRTNSLSGDGISRLAETIEGFYAEQQRSGRSRERRRDQWKARLGAMIRGELIRAAGQRGLDANQLERYADSVTDGDRNPYELVSDVVANLLKQEG